MRRLNASIDAYINERITITMIGLLSPAEVVELTARKRSDGQRRALDAMGIPYKTRHDGSLVVARDTVTEALGHAPEKNRPPSPRLRLSAA